MPPRWKKHRGQLQPAPLAVVPYAPSAPSTNYILRPYSMTKTNTENKSHPPDNLTPIPKRLTVPPRRLNPIL